MKTVKTYSPKTKILSLVLSFLIIFYLVPASVFAEAPDNDTTVSDTTASVNEENNTYTPEIYEVTELREENVKHFRLEDGSYVAAQYNYPVHYIDANGQFADIDNRLVDSGSDYSTANSRIKFIKKITGNGNIFTLHENNTKVSVGLVGAEKKTEGVVSSIAGSDDYEDNTLGKLTSLENLSSRIIYRDILDGVDIEYIVHSLNIKENLIVKERKENYSYSFNIELNNLVATLADDGNVYISSNDEEIRYIIPAPIVYDAAGIYAPDTSSAYILTASGNGKYELTVTVDPNWMNAKDRAFPVTIDPPMMTANGGVIDFNIDSELPNTNTNGNYNFYVSSTERAYLKFNENYFTTVPPGTTITKAELSLMGNTYQSGTARVGVYPIISDWDSTLTWNKTLAVTPQGTFDNTPLDYVTVNRSDTRYTWDITPLYKDWLAGGTNYGVGLRLVYESTVDYAQFSCYENQDASNYRKPIIMVTYISNDGLESYYPTVAHSAGTGGVGSINLATGRMTLAIPTLTTTDSLFAFTPTLVYNSSLAGKNVTSAYVDVPFSTSYMPDGFKLNIQETIIEKNYYDENNVSHIYYSLYDSDGTTHYFFSSGDDDTKYYDDSGLRLTLTVETNEIKITDIDQNVKTYSKISGGWHLTSITDHFGNELIFEFDSEYRPDNIKVKPNGLAGIEMLQFLYSGNKLCAVYNDNTKDSVIIRYSGNNLTTVQYCYGNSNASEQNVMDAYANLATAENVAVYATASYTYDSNGHITRVTDSDTNKSLQYEISNGKITKLSEYAGTTLGQQISFTYGKGYTDLRSSGNNEILNTDDDIITRYVFDNYCRSVSVYSMSADGAEIYGSTTGTYETNHMAKNSIKSNTVLYGIDPEYILEKSASTEYFATIQGGLGTTEATGTYTQMVFSEDNVESLTQSNANMEYIVSGFGYSNSIMKKDFSDFSLGVNVYYYQGQGEEDVVVKYRFDFAEAENIWQFASGKFRCDIPSDNTVSYEYVKQIDIVCSYYGQLDNGSEAAYANFKDISYKSLSIDNGYNYTYDTSNGSLNKKENSLYYETYSYDDQNRIEVIENSYGEKYRYAYGVQEDDNTTTDCEYYFRNENIVSATAYIYNSFGLLTNTSCLGSSTDSISSGNIGTLTAINTSYEYETSSDSIVFGALTREMDSLGNITTYAYDPTSGLLSAVRNITAGTGYFYHCDDAHRLDYVLPIFMNSEVTNAENVNYGYNSAGYLASISTDSTVYNLSYDIYGNAAGVSAGNNTLATYEYYPNNGKLKKINYGNDFSEEYVYNSLEMLTEIWYTYDDGTRVLAYEYEYTTSGQLDNIVDNLLGKTTVYSYDSNGKIISSGQYDSEERELYSEYFYDDLYRLSNVTTQIGYSVGNNQNYISLTQEYGYSNSSILSTFKTHGANIGYSYDSLNRLTNKTVSYIASGSTPTYSNEISYTYKTGSYIVGEYQNKINGTTTSRFNYVYDSNGNITKITDKSGKEIRYYYGVSNKLSSVEDEVANKEYVYHYDTAGNVTSIMTNTLSSGDGGVGDDIIIRALNPTLPSNTQTLSYTNTQWGDLLTSYNGHTITYDEIGNPLSYYNGSSYTFTWDGRRLASVEKGLIYATFAYNDEGLRVRKTVEGETTTYLYDGNVLIAEYAPNYTCVYIYDESGAIIGAKYISTAENSTWQTYFFEKNLQGDVIAVYSDTGTKLVSYLYDAWGNVTTTYHNGGASTLAANNPIRYRGYYYDTTLQMYYLQSRYYDAKICRFINADGQLNIDNLLGNNLYVYCYNNPVMYVDYTGCEPDWWLLFEGSMFVFMGVVTVAAVFATGGSCLPLVQLAYLGLISSGVLATSIGASEIYESFTGDNPIKDSVGEQAYDTLKYGSMFVMSMGASIIEYGTAISVCFVAGTLVKAAEGDVPIENIQVGDYVYAHNPETGETELKPVVNTFVNEATELVHVFADGEEIICTNEHPFYSPVKGWITACKLRAGDILVSLNGEYIVVEQIQHEILEAPIKVYNFEVDDFHTYFVGDGNGVLVHNSCNHNSAWNTERRNYWKMRANTDELNHDYGAYKATANNIERMRNGLAPKGWDDQSVQLHHPNGIANDFYNYYPVSRTFHIFLHGKE